MATDVSQLSGTASRKLIRGNRKSDVGFFRLPRPNPDHPLSSLLCIKTLCTYSHCNSLGPCRVVAQKPVAADAQFGVTMATDLSSSACHDVIIGVLDKECRVVAKRRWSIRCSYNSRRSRDGSSRTDPGKPEVATTPLMTSSSASSSSKQVASWRYNVLLVTGSTAATVFHLIVVASVLARRRSGVAVADGTSARVSRQDGDDGDGAGAPRNAARVPLPDTDATLLL